MAGRGRLEGGGSGGARPGSGRRRKSDKLKIAHGTASIRERLAAAAALDGPASPESILAARAVGVAPPAGMTELELEVWEELAPEAIKARTLTAATARAFALLCRAVVLERRFLEVIEGDGFVQSTAQGDKAHPLIVPHRGMLQRAEAAMVRFRLSPIGRELEEAQPAKPQSKLAMLRGGA